MRTFSRLAVAALSLFGSSALAADFAPFNKGRSISMAGEIGAGDAERFAMLYDRLYSRGFRPERIFLNSTGGSVGEAARLSKVVGRAQVDTVVGKTDVCASACVMVFAAGRKRVAFTTSRIGLHAATSVGINSVGEVQMQEDQRALAMTTLMARLYATMGVPYRVIGRMVATPNDGIAWITQTDAREWGIEIIRVPGVVPEPEAIGEMR